MISTKYNTKPKIHNNKMGKPVIISLILAGLAAAQLSAAANNCKTHNGESGSCLFLENCNSLQKIMTALSPVQRVGKLYEIRTECGYEDDRLLVCCPDSDYIATNNQQKRESRGDASNCKSLNGENGSCLFLENCKDLYTDIIALSAVERVGKIYGIRSQCGYDNDRFLICCPDSDSTFLKTLPAPVTPEPTQATPPPTTATPPPTQAAAPPPPAPPPPFQANEFAKLLANLPVINSENPPKLNLQCSYTTSASPQEGPNGIKYTSQSYVFTSGSGGTTDMKCGNESKALLGLVSNVLQNILNKSS